MCAARRRAQLHAQLEAKLAEIATLERAAMQTQIEHAAALEQAAPSHGVSHKDLVS